MTWVLAAWTVLWAVLVVVGVLGVLTKSCSDIVDAAFSGDSTCANIVLRGKAETAGDVAGGRFVLWLIGFALLGLVWVLTREKKRLCPHCGEEVAKGLTTCAKCGYDFTLGRNPAQAAAVAAAPPPAWYDDAERPGHKRWWDGTTWGVRDDEPPPVGLAGQEGGT